MSEVISISERKKKKEQAENQEPSSEGKKISFEKLAEINSEKKKKLEEERKKKNQSVLRAYRIK